VTTLPRRSNLPLDWPKGFHPMMRAGGRRPTEPANEGAHAWYGIDRDPAHHVDVEAAEDVLNDYRRGVQAFAEEPTSLAPPPGGPPELRARHEVAPGLLNPVGIPLADAQRRKEPTITREKPSDLIVCGVVRLPTGGSEATQIVGADPFRRRLILSTIGQCWIIPPGQRPADPGDGIPQTGLLVDSTRTSPLILNTTAGVSAWAAFAGAVVTWMAEVETTAISLAG